MNFLQSFVLGIVEGVTEYLPISSTFHLILSANLMNIVSSEFLKAYEVIIQGGAILAILVLYFKKYFLKMSILKKLIISFIPIALVGFFLYPVIKNYFFENIILQVLMFIIVGLLFILFERYYFKDLGKTISELTYKDAIIIGILQTLAVIPGVSRAGIVILGLMFLKYKRDEAALYSFLLAVPTLLAASSWDFIKIVPTISFSDEKIWLLMMGFIASFVSAYIVVKWFTGFLQKHKLTFFGWYRIVLGILIFIFFVL